MGGFDILILRFLNGSSGYSENFDKFMFLLSGNYLYKGVFLMLLFWYLWFSELNARQIVRINLISAVAVAALAILVGRTLSNLLPYRPRPIHTLGLDINHPIGMPMNTLANWSSMPSDHAVLFFTLAACFWMVNRTIGTIAFLHALLIISLPRVYLALHYPSDILVGALLGIILAALLLKPLAGVVERLQILRFEASFPQLFYPAMFLVTFEIASMFDSVRSLLRSTTEVVGFVSG